ncbi:MAG: SLOG cluster 4 domain-containing protein [Vulcanimicrobiaceae bacterium]
MKIQIGVMGSAGGILTDHELDLARRTGRRIAQRGCTIVTGACPGLPHAAVLGAHEAGGSSLGVSPAYSREEHVNIFGSPLQPYTTIVFTGSGLMGRETHNIHSSDFVLYVGGRSGTLGEFCIAFDEGKLIGILRDSGGISNEFSRIAALVQKETGSFIIEHREPEALVDACLDYYLKEPMPSSVAFNRHDLPSVDRPSITQESRG